MTQDSSLLSRTLETLRRIVNNPFARDGPEPRTDRMPQPPLLQTGIGVVAPYDFARGDTGCWSWPGRGARW
jgi:hypothetical protein